MREIDGSVGGGQILRRSLSPVAAVDRSGAAPTGSAP